MKREAVVRGDKPERNTLKRSFQAKALAERETYYNGIADEAELALQRHDMKPIYRAVKHISKRQPRAFFQRKLAASPALRKRKLC